MARKNDTLLLGAVAVLGAFVFARKAQAAKAAAIVQAVEANQNASIDPYGFFNVDTNALPSLRPAVGAPPAESRQYPLTGNTVMYAGGSPNFYNPSIPKDYSASGKIPS